MISSDIQRVTLKEPEGNTKTVKARNTSSLLKIAVDNKVLVTHTEAVAIAVVEKYHTVTAPLFANYH